MTYRKNGEFAYKIIKKDNVMELASFFEELLAEDEGQISFRVDFYDNSSITGDTSDIFESGVFKRKDAKTIHFCYSCKACNKEVEVTLREALWISNVLNTYEIRSSDEKWYNATLQKLEDILSGITKRSVFRRFWGFPLCLVNYVLWFFLTEFLVLTPLGFKYGRIPEEVTTYLPFEPKPSEDAALFIPNSLLFLVITVIFAAIVIFIHFLYPEMEFAFNSNRYIHRKKWRIAIGWIFTAIIVPIALSILLNV